MRARLDADQQEALRALLTATITALNEAPASQPTRIADGFAAAP